MEVLGVASPSFAFLRLFTHVGWEGEEKSKQTKVKKPSSLAWFLVTHLWTFLGCDICMLSLPSCRISSKLLSLVNNPGTPCWFSIQILARVDPVSWNRSRSARCCHLWRSTEPCLFESPIKILTKHWITNKRFKFFPFLKSVFFF